MHGPDARGPWDDVDELELATLSWVPLQLVHALRVRAGDTIGDVAFTHPRAHRLDAVAELLGDPLHRALARAQLVAQLADQPDRLILLGIGVPTRRRLPR